MTLQAGQEEILEQLIRQERLLSRLYGLFSEHFSAFQDFWANLSREEERHARIIEKLQSAAQKGSVFFDQGAVRSQTLNLFIQRLEDLVKKAERNEFTPSSAFSCAIDYETALIEKDVFSRFEAIHPKAKSALMVLRSETKNHVEHVREFRKKADG